MPVLLLSLLLAAPLAAQPSLDSLPMKGEWPLELAQSLFADAKAPLPAALWPEDWALGAYVNDMGEPSCPGRFDADGLKDGKPGAAVQKGVMRDGAEGGVVHFLPCYVPGRSFKSASFRFPLTPSPGLACRALDADAAICRVEMESAPADGSAGPSRSYHYFGLGKRLAAAK